MSGTQLIDQYGRKLDYLRLSVTDRCNFRCYYCMPEKGINFAPRTELLSFQEMYDLAAIFVQLGIKKIRITGGEPFVRNGIIPFLYRLSALSKPEEITITSNGTLSAKHQSALKEMGIRKINISLDSLDPVRFFSITRRDCFQQVYKGIFDLLQNGFEVKLNCVVAENKNVEDIMPFVKLTKDYPLSVRFLEEMPFNGSAESNERMMWDHQRIYDHIRLHEAAIIPLIDPVNSTSVNYRVNGYQGTFGIIPSFSRTFCGTCNRVRLSATGELRTCLYGPPVANLRDLIRNGADVIDIKEAIQQALSYRARDGFEAEKLSGSNIHTSMSSLGG
ncbi:GTP 3',8-cyclase MoaA [Mucilaginibacter sp. UR6-1]|uniref:GTP 3',8-cyclase MoaA n=1 Tax=Mucilaginibacter sp. UR6-1 TaxID=1435643 RepID=UPI001E31AC90|nr:GTP 3',8-cyclase MoaA [Mucilaginibacter sp. UR6-1]MCC8409454.1 GTP 3',8-cyclase MoaA [Mucilaginibacter sp. UR6-1]